MKLDESLTSVLRSRAKKCIDLSSGHLKKGEFFLGGSAIATNLISDIDIYPAGSAIFHIPDSAPVLYSSKNATTISNKPPLQYCKYKHDTLDELIESFDFAHVQAGAYIVDGQVSKVAWTNNFVVANAIRSSEFTGSAYPLSSAIRLLKYNNREELTRNSSIRAMLDILCAIVKRGFKDYEDFKDQLDAVDLGLTPDDLDEVSKAKLMDLFEALKKGLDD